VTRPAGRPAGALRILRRPSVHVGVMWLALGSILGEFATHARDYVDNDAGRYERLAISIARTHSLVPRINGVDIHYYSLLYPILLAPFFVAGTMWSDLEHAGVASAYIMASACIPAFLLTRRVTAARWAPYAVALLSVCMPWIVTSVFLMTEVAAYPMFVWALYAMVVSVSAPSAKHDLLMVLATALGFFARGELIVLAIVYPLALAAFELGRAPAGGARERAVAAGRTIVRSHPILSAAYVVAGGAALALYVQGGLSSAIGIYSTYSNAGNPAWSRLPRSLVEHLATFSLGVGVVPCVIGLAWIGANTVRARAGRDAHAFACVAALTTFVVFVQTTNFDLVVNAYVHDRFLMYFVPVMLIGTVLAVADERKPRWSLVAPLLLVVAGFVFGAIPSVAWGRFTWLDLDTPISTVYRVLAFHLGGLTDARAVLVALAVAGTGLFALVARRFPGRPLTLGVLTFSVVTMAVATSWVFVRAFTSQDRNGRVVTASWHGTLDWIDQAVGANNSVTAIEYPVSSNWVVNQGAWRDFDYFNKSLVRDARLPNLDPFDYLGLWFPKLDLHLDRRTGAVAESPTRWIVASQKETRFRIAGPAVESDEGAMLIDAGAHWRLAWATSGLYDDGWTRPGVTMRMRIYPYAGQRRPRLRTVAFVLRAPVDVPRRPIALSTRGKTVHAVITPDDSDEDVDVCVPADGYAELTLTVDGSSTIPGDLATEAESVEPRQGGIFIASLAVADEIGGVCPTSAG
jgi:hypothetical protein